eukprot:TRINITY_DN20786_c0_g1_i2.p1 TRINITY_DN20786_c0_g1~~TRINITY_DN20786_c0_g1_i2.p1  ORF type:complete len:623 (-),score=100.09 TRINITY_DN20786_c0_g1_i2:441-2309(-)
MGVSGTAAGENDTNDKRLVNQLVVQVPLGATPGQTKLRVDPGDGFHLVVTVPVEAKPGDELVLTEAGQDDWECQLRPAKGAENSSGSRAGCPATLGGKITVPADATPGETSLHVGIGNELHQVTVPENALPGDILHLVFEDAEWTLKIIRRSPEAPSGGRKLNIMVADINADACYEGMKSACIAAGGFVSPKLRRGLAPPLNVPGIILTEPVSKGEVLLRVPASLHVSEATCKAKLPELFEAVRTSQDISQSRRTEAALTSCVSALLCDAFARASCRSASQSQRNEFNGSFPDLWLPYATLLAGENFGFHPFWRCLLEPGYYEKRMGPSGEPAYYRLMSGDCIAVHDIIKESVPRWQELVGQAFEPGIYMHARLSLLSREFGTKYGSALVPIIDLCNHSSAPGAHQSWDYEGDALALTAVRDLQAGEELLITYGAMSNPLLLRTYGFTLPPRLEPAWTICFRIQELIDIAGPDVRPQLESEFLPLVEFQLNSRDVMDFFLTALTILVRGSSLSLMRYLFKEKLSAYELDSSMFAALEAFRKVRLIDRRKHSWWLEVDSDGEASEPGSEEALAVKMSEYLCLTAHIEALDVLTGAQKEEECLQGGLPLREALAAAFKRLDLEP